jgi:PIN domain nuclease of toxin-antitoxin system
MPTLLDTHVWLWWVTGDARISKRAKAAIESARKRGYLWLSMISIWEIAKKVEKQQLAFDRPLDQWLDEALSIDGLRQWELTRPVLVESCQLPSPFHGDPADQLIVATARHHRAVLVTRDERIRRYEHVSSTW